MQKVGPLNVTNCGKRRASAKARPVMRALRIILPILAILWLSMPLSSAASPPPTSQGNSVPLLPGWPMFHGNPALTGAIGGSSPLRAHELWSSLLPLSPPLLNDPPYAPSPVVSGGQVYQASDNVLYDLNSTSGQMVSATYLPGGSGSGPVVSTPLLLSSGVLATAQDGGPNQMWFGALSGSSTATCNLGGNPASGSATVVGNSVFQTDTSGNIWRITLGTLLGCPTSPWAAPAGAQYFSTPSVGYVGGVPTLYVVDSGTRLLDAYQGVGSSVGTSPPGFPVTLSGNRVRGSLSLVNMTNGSQLLPVGFLGDSSGGGGTTHLFAVNLSTGVVLATLDIPAPAGGGNSGIAATPALSLSANPTSSERVYFGNLGGNLSEASFSMGPSGSRFAWGWNFTGHGSFYASPVLWGNLVIDGDASGWLYALNASTGALEWEADLGSALYASPALADGTVFESTANGQIVALAAAPLPMSMIVPPNVTGGTTVHVKVHVGGLNASGVPQGNLSGVQVSLASSAGIELTSVATTDVTGTATFTWTAPFPTNTPVTVFFTASSNPLGYAPSQTSGATVVPPGSGSVAVPLTLSTSLSNTSLTAGGTTFVNVTSLLNTLPAAGASVSLVLSPNLGSVAPALVTADSSGRASFVYTAPGSVPAVASLLITASATLGNHSGISSTPLTLLPNTNLNGLAVSFLTQGSSVAAMGSVVMSVSVTNSSSGTAQTNTHVSFSVASVRLGSFAQPSTYTNATGIASAVFDAGTVGTASSTLVTAVADASGRSSGTASSIISVAPWGLNLTWILPQSGLGAGQASTIGVQARSGGVSAGAGLSVNLVLSPAVSGTLNTSTGKTDAQGIAWFSLTPAGSVHSLTLNATAGGGSGPYAAAATFASLSLSTKAASGTPSIPIYFWLLVAVLAAATGILLLVLLTTSRKRETTEATPTGNLDGKPPQNPEGPKPKAEKGVKSPQANVSGSENATEPPAEGAPTETSPEQGAAGEIPVASSTSGEPGSEWKE